MDLHPLFSFFFSLYKLVYLSIWDSSYEFTVLSSTKDCIVVFVNHYSAVVSVYELLLIVNCVYELVYLSILDSSYEFLVLSSMKDCIVSVCVCESLLSTC